MYEAASISKAMHAGPLLKEGIVARRTGLTPDLASSFATSITSALTSRITQGEERPFKDMSWTSLLENIQKKERETQMHAEATPILPFFRPPAKDEDIEGAEKRLGVHLPSDFKEFLKVTNGLGSHDPFLGLVPIAWPLFIS